MDLGGFQGPFSLERTHPYRHRIDTCALEVMLHIRRQLVDARLLGAIARAMHVAVRSERGSEHNPAGLSGHHQPGSVPAGHVGGAQSNIQDRAGLQALVPERLRGDQLRMHVGSIVDQNIQLPCFLLNLAENLGHGGIIAVVATQGHALTTGLGYRCGSLMDCAGEDGAIPGLGRTRCLRASGHIDPVAVLTQGPGDTRPRAPTGTGHQRHSCALRHTRNPPDLSWLCRQFLGTEHQRLRHRRKTPAQKVTHKQPHQR